MKKMSPDEFFAWLADSAVQICHAYGLPACVCMAQAALESGWGEYTIGDYNLFGRKAVDGDKSIIVPTQEYYDGQWVTVEAAFKDYDSLDEAIEDWCILITQEPAYEEVNNHLDSIEGFVYALGPIYATDPQYADKVLATIDANNLRQYDAGMFGC